MDASADLGPLLIQRAIRHRGFQIVYQPMLHIGTGTVVGVEALCRFKDGRSPQRWFEAAERCGLAPDLDLAIIESALWDIPALPPGYLSLNLSPSTLLDPRLLDLLQGASTPLDRVIVEITEHARVLNYGEATKTLAALRENGVLVAVDDAGAGYATFRHVLRLRPDIIKLDHSITQHIDEDPARVALATALVIFGGEIGALVVAEGVETHGELTALQTAGVSHAQGFALARPQSLPLTLPEQRTTPRRPPRDITPAAAAARTEAKAVSAHELLNPVSSMELALDLLRRKAEEIGEDECMALVHSAQRQARYVGGALEGLARGLEEPTLIVLDDHTADTDAAAAVDDNVDAAVDHNIDDDTDAILHR